MKLLFWITGGALFYTYLGYPLLIKLAGRLFHRPAQGGDFSTGLPSTSVLVVVHNGQDKIRARLENLLTQDFPIQEVLVVCDGCTDQTERVVTQMSDPRIKLITRAKRTGKSACLNQGIQSASGEILILTDVRQTFQSDAIRKIVANFADPKVGAVSGALKIVAASNAVGKGVDSYWNLEKAIREAESRLDSCIGCTGAIYGIRRALFSPIPESTILDDVVIPMQIAVSGYRVLFEPGAIAFDPQPLNPALESVRKRRTLSGNFQLLFRYLEWLVPWKNRLWIQLLSHKYLRLMAPLFLLAILLANVLLANQPFYRATLFLQLAFYFSGIVGRFPWAKGIKVFSLSSGFLFLNQMVIAGFMEFLRRNEGGTWESPSTSKDQAA